MTMTPAELTHTTTARWHDAIQRAVDITISALILLFLSPLVLLIAITIAVCLGRPVLFRQSRPGLHGRIFQLVKFRTMLEVDPSKGRVSDAERMTPLGRLLRATSLDELPTLWNVLNGSMSLVGPRPLRVHYLQRYTPEQARRHLVRPGVTGLAQVRGRNSISWEEKFKWDIEYVERRSLSLNARILLATLRTVTRRDGISADGEATMPEFLGTSVVDQLPRQDKFSTRNV